MPPNNPLFQWSKVDPHTGDTIIYSSKGNNTHSNSGSSARYSRLHNIEHEDRDAYSYRDSPDRSVAGYNDNDADVYDYEYHDDPAAASAAVVPSSEAEAYAYAEGYAYADEDPELRVKTSSFDSGEGSTIYDPESGAYDQMLDYVAGSGSYRHHRERLTEDGVFQARDVQKREDGSRHVRREYENPGTGTRTVRDYER